MRIVTRADFDSVTCAVLLGDALDIDEETYWVEPSEIQKKKADIKKGDILANLPYDENCSLWFDHHYSNSIKTEFEGLFRIAPSAAGLIYEYYQKKLSRDFSELVAQTDKIDSADLSLAEVLHPEEHPYILLSMTISSRTKEDEPYWNLLVELLRRFDINEVLENGQVKEKCRQVVVDNKEYKNFLKEYTRTSGPVSITDFRSLNRPPSGNRFLVYSLFPETAVNVKIRHDLVDRDLVIVSIGYNVFGPGCHVNIGELLSRFEGGGHASVGACSFTKDKSEKYLKQIIETLVANNPSPEAV